MSALIEQDCIPKASLYPPFAFSAVILAGFGESGQVVSRAGCGIAIAKVVVQWVVGE
jgi:hypothetical protein